MRVPIALGLLVILGVIVFLRVSPGFGLHDPSVARLHQIRADIDLIESEVNAFQAKNGRYPENLGEVLHDNFPMSRMTKLPIDPWGRPYNYDVRGRTDAKKPLIWTNGADGVPGGTGGNQDLSNQTDWALLLK